MAALGATRCDAVLLVLAFLVCVESGRRGGGMRSGGSFSIRSILRHAGLSLNPDLAAALAETVRVTMSLGRVRTWVSLPTFTVHLPRHVYTIAALLRHCRVMCTQWQVSVMTELEPSQ